MSREKDFAATGGVARVEQESNPAGHRSAIGEQKPPSAAQKPGQPSKRAARRAKGLANGEIILAVWAKSSTNRVPIPKSRVGLSLNVLFVEHCIRFEELDQERFYL